MARPHIGLSGGRWHLFRLTDDEFSLLGQHALPILQNLELLEELQQRLSDDAAHLSLGQALTVLERKFGPSSPLYDSYRGSFSFPLLVTMLRRRRISYLLRCHDHRGTIHFPMYRVVSGEPSASDRAKVHAPLKDEFSQSDMDEFVRSLHRFLLGYADLLASELVASFYRAIRSDLILYGYTGQSFFEHHCDEIATFVRHRADLDARLGWHNDPSPSTRIERLIDRVTEAMETRNPLD